MIHLIHEALTDALPIIENAAPLVASAIGSPLAGVAIKCIEDVLGLKGGDLPALTSHILSDTSINDKLASAQSHFMQYLQSNCLNRPLLKANISINLEWDSLNNSAKEGEK